MYLNKICVKFIFDFFKDSTTQEHFFMTKHTDYEINDLSSFTKYKIWVVAYNQNGPGLNSLELFVQTKSSNPTQPPKNIVVEAISSTVCITYCSNWNSKINFVLLL